MSLITKDHLSLTLQAIKKLLSFKADKTEVVLRNEVEEADAIELVAKMELVTPIATQNNKIITDSQGRICSL